MARLNRAGIPILDPPGENKLPKRCAPDCHCYGEIRRRNTGGYDWMTESYEVERLLRCSICGDLVFRVSWEAH